ncbi:DUF1344 domain-containing protein [Brucellaceae bacterium C25G]
MKQQLTVNQHAPKRIAAKSEEWKIKMRKIIFATLAVSAIISTSIASAATFTTVGTIEKLNSLSNTIELSNGQFYKLPSGTDLNGVSTGQKVQINWSTQNPSWVSKSGSEADRVLINADSIAPAH